MSPRRWLLALAVVALCATQCKSENITDPRFALCVTSPGVLCNGRGECTKPAPVFGGNLTCECDSL